MAMRPQTRLDKVEQLMDLERQATLHARQQDELIRLTVRGFGYRTVHYARLPFSAVRPLAAGSGRPGERLILGVATPVAAMCGATVRSAQPFVRVAVREALTCPGCERGEQARVHSAAAE